MDNWSGISFAQKLAERGRCRARSASPDPEAPAFGSGRAPRLATAVEADKLSVMTAQAIAGLKQLLATAEPPELGPQPRVNVQSAAALNAQLDSLFRATDLALERQQLIRSLVLLWHDHLEAAHTIAQGIENPDGSFVHALMHRREPDYLNAKYWWRRVGAHPAFPEIARRVEELLTGSRRREEADPGDLGKVRLLTSAATNADFAKRLVPAGKWDASAFVDLCEGAKAEPVIRTLREVQRVETEGLLDFFCHE
jgi:hypothetical protein